MSVLKLDRYIKNVKGDKVESKTRSVNLEQRHIEFLNQRKLNLSLMVRDLIDKLIKDETDEL